MRKGLISPLRGIISPFLRRVGSALGAYIRNGFTPQLVACFKSGTYGKGGAPSTFGGVLEHSRASAATYIDAGGVLQTAAADEARENHHVYNGTAWVKEGYLHEPEAVTNLVTYSEDFTDAGWHNVVTTEVSLGASACGVELWEIEIIAAAARPRIQWSFTDLAVGNYVFSFFAQENSEGSIDFALVNTTGDIGGGDPTKDVSFNPSTETFNIVDAGLGTPRFEEFANNVYRISIPFEVVTTATVFLQLVADVGETLGATGVFGGAQLEVGSVPTSYIPTNGATATRSADILTVPIENITYPTFVETTGVELVTNGTFDTDSDWGKGDGWTISGGQAAHAAGASSNLTQSVFTAGKVYQVSWDQTGGFVAVYMDGFGSLLSNGAVDGPRTVTSASVTGGNITFRCGDAVTIDNISVREINPLAVSFGYKALVTGENAGFAIWAADASNVILIDAGTNDFTFTQEAGGVVDTVTGGSYTSGINVPFSIASRHGSTFINGAVDGTALTANTTPTAFPDLSTTDLVIAPSGGPQVIQEVIMWSEDIGAAGIEEASA